MTTVLTDQGEHQLAGPAAWASAAEAERIAGWQLKPEGMCRDELCVALPPGLQRDGKIDLAGFWRLLGAPVVSDAAGTAVVLGTAAAARTAALASLDAPDFSLPDLAGAPHTLSALRGKKIFLSTWASW